MIIEPILICVTGKPVLGFVCVGLDLLSPMVLGLMVSFTPELARLGPVAPIRWIRNNAY